jgi:hypothetical protein
MASKEASSHAERQAQHAATRAALDEARNSQVEFGKKLIGEAEDRHRAESARIESEHAAENLAARVASQRSCAEGFRAVVAAFGSEPTRENARLVAAKFRELEAAALHSTGAQVSRELGFAFAGSVIESDSGALPRFAMLSAFNADPLGCIEQIEVANRACRMVGASGAPAVQQALEGLERQIARIAEQGQRAPVETAAARFEALRFSGDYSKAAAAIAKIERQERAPIEAAAWAKTPQHRRGFQVLEALAGHAVDAIDGAFGRQ